jgi:hypothetical protein
MVADAECARGGHPSRGVDLSGSLKGADPDQIRKPISAALVPCTTGHASVALAATRRSYPQPAEAAGGAI